MKRVSVLALLLFTALVLPAPAHAQLISPGKLSAAHASVEGMRQCTQCHELGQRGTSNERCLSCHTVLKSRIQESRGYHATVRQDECSKCHKDHLGRGVSPLRFDTSSFRHDVTGYRLKGAHVEQTCRDCHAPAHITARDVRGYQGGANFLKVTFLGLGTSCTSCHTNDSPHGRQFARRGCQECHEEKEWERATLYDHKDARFTLTGAHNTVKCEGCHTSVGDTVRYRGLAFASCADCHRDPHRGGMAGTCARCHSTADWQRVDGGEVASSFNHARTNFPLKGAHVRVDCARCHRPSRDPGIHLTFAAGTERSTFARPVVRTCASCHSDPHPKSFKAVPGEDPCASCHVITGWRPVKYEVAQHNRAGNFALDGAHAAAPCSACHTTRAAPPRVCASCHSREDPHKGAFGKQSCSDCHDTESFQDGRLDHKRVEHLACASCHAKHDPHGEQFARRSCGDCHATTSFRIQRFDHAATGYALDGAHSRVLCSACHRNETTVAGARFVRYKPLAKACKDCHGGKP